MYSVLRVPSFALLWFGGVITNIGDRALRIALPYFVFMETGSTVATALLAFAHYLPGLLFGPVAGVLADRWDRRRILVVSNLVQFAVILLLVLAPLEGWLWVTYAVTFAELAIAMLIMPASGALLPTLVREEQLPQANALIGLGSTVSRLLGPLVGGALIGLFGLTSVIVFDSVSFLLAAGMFALIPAGASVRPAIQRVRRTLLSGWRDLAREWSDGVREVRRSRALVALFLTMNFTSLGGCLIDPFFAPFVASSLREGPEAVGVLSMAVALGTLLGGLVAAHFTARFSQRAVVGYGTVVVGAMMVLVYNQVSLPPAVGLIFLMGLPLVVSNVAAQTLLQVSTTDEYRGRVYGALGTTNAFVGVISVLAAAVLGEVVGTVGMLTVAGVITVLAGLLGLVLLPRERAMPAADAVTAGAAP